MAAPSCPAAGRRFSCSWSGGKDGALALHRAVLAGARPVCLLTMMTETGERSRSHGLAPSVLRAQAACLRLELRTAEASWADYERALARLLAGCAAEGVRDAVFGDLDIDAHRVFEERVCATAGVTAHLPLWGADRIAALEEGWRAGLVATIVVVRAGVLGAEWLGRVLDRDAARALAEAGVDPCGENGEFHTLVTDGPMFTEPLVVERREPVRRAGCWVLDLEHRPGSPP